MDTIWQHAKFKISNFCKIRITPSGGSVSSFVERVVRNLWLWLLFMEFKQRKLSANLQRLVESIMLYFNKPINYDNGCGRKKREHLGILPKTGVDRCRVNPITTSIFLLLLSFNRWDCHKNSKTIWAKIPKVGIWIWIWEIPIFFHFFYWTTSLMLSKSGECLQKFSFVRKRGGGVWFFL